MTRIEFCNHLRELRLQSEVKVKDISFKMNMLPAEIYNIERAKNNFNIFLIYNYISSINYKFSIQKENQIVILNTKELVSSWIQQLVNEYGSKSNVAKMSNIQRITVSNLINCKTSLSIEVFLRMVDAFGYEIKIEQI